MTAAIDRVCARLLRRRGLLTRRDRCREEARPAGQCALAFIIPGRETGLLPSTRSDRPPPPVGVILRHKRARERQPVLTIAFA